MCFYAAGAMLPSMFKKRADHTSLMIIAGFIAFGILVARNDGSLSSHIGRNSVHLQAKTWNDGRVYLWSALAEGPDVPYAIFPDGAYCTKIDNNWYILGSGETAIYYYKLLCGGKIGYVESDQVR